MLQPQPAGVWGMNIIQVIHTFRVEINILTLKLESYAYKNRNKKHTMAYTHKGGLGSK